MEFIIFGVPIALTILGMVLLRGSRRKYIDITMKVIALMYIFIVATKFLFSDSFITVINKGYLDKVYYDKTDLLQSYLRWFLHISGIVVPMSIFYKNRVFRNIAVYFCLPVAVACVFDFDTFISYFMDYKGRGLEASKSFREFYLALELIVCITFCMYMRWVKGHRFAIKNPKEWATVAIAFPFVALSMIPNYFPQSVFGHISIGMGTFSIGNFIWMAFLVVEINVIYRIFRFRSRADRHMICMYLALSLFVNYNSMFLMGFNFKRLPIQLCNLASYFFIIALITRSQKLFNFAFLANTIGTVIAITLPDISADVTSIWNIHYIMEHTQVFCVPILCMLLRIFDRLPGKAILHLVVGFSTYFIFCWTAGLYINSFTHVTGQGQVNYFFIFEAEGAATLVTALRPLLAWKFNPFGTYTVYPMFQLAVYLFFLSLCIVFFFAMLKIYDIIDDDFRLRRARIELVEKITGKPSKAKKEYDEC